MSVIGRSQGHAHFVVYINCDAQKGRDRFAHFSCFFFTNSTCEKKQKHVQNLPQRVRNSCRTVSLKRFASCREEGAFSTATQVFTRMAVVSTFNFSTYYAHTRMCTTFSVEHE